ncbi:MAG: hypothetical protein VX278_16435, partial [Myxococcota bacterium]|nr:hypothetical protein [Myxococcota bacterium]
VLDPFSAKRNDRLNEVIRYLSRGCRNFDVHLQNGSRQWKGEKCAAGTVRIEWAPTTKYWMRILLYDFSP